ncbi:calcium-binding protein [Streptomyces canus]|uniref:calcium-binding protein n=1 Tax=Streptomyces canus TaxID=58343 RepID=UPI0038631EA5|nr:calcium-binding protein [Streptomyces canus]
MRIRATVAAVSGALALSALAVPASQAADGGVGKTTAAERFGVSRSAMRTAAAAEELPVVSKVTINGAKGVVVGTTAAKKFTVSLTASHSAGIQDAYIDLWHGKDLDHIDGLLPPNEEAAGCTAVNATTSNCKLTITAVPGSDLYMNALAGTWHVTAGVLANDEAGSVYWNDFYSTHRVQRLSKLTVNASPEPVKKGKTITVTGKLTRANWEIRKYAGYTSQPVKLQFRKKDSNTYTTVKTIKTNNRGDLKTTVKATVDGFFRWSFAGTSTTPAVNAAGDFVDVK